jgi:hypothetical protein
LASTNQFISHASTPIFSVHRPNHSPQLKKRRGNVILSNYSHDANSRNGRLLNGRRARRVPSLPAGPGAGPEHRVENATRRLEIAKNSGKSLT